MDRQIIQDDDIAFLERGRAELTIDALWRAVDDIVPVFTPAECANCFQAAGYDAT